MGKATAAQAAITKQKIIDAAFDIALNEGFKKATFASIAKKAGISKSGIHAHFSLKADIANEIRPRFAQIINQHLDYSSVAAFKQSWQDAIDNKPKFVAAITACGPVIPKNDGIQVLVQKIQGDEKEIIDAIYHCIGYAICHIDIE